MKEKRNKTWLRKLVLMALCLTLTVVSIPCPVQAADSDSKLEVTFLDVGQADAALIQCDGHSMLIDGGNAADSSKMYTVMKNHKITELDYVIGTHAHEDHIGGLAGALNYASVKTAYAPVTTYDSKAFQNFRKAVEKHGVSLTVPQKDDTFSLGSAECKILAVNSDSDTNNTSIVLRITFGGTSFLFAGDAEREAEQAILNSKQDIQSTVLKVGHHGSETSTSYLWLREVMPKYAVISVGKDNSYGHPTDEVLSGRGMQRSPPSEPICREISPVCPMEKRWSLRYPEIRMRMCLHPLEPTAPKRQLRTQPQSLPQRANLLNRPMC